jgi:hypothetical protein
VIRQLLKRDPLWRATPWAVVLCAVLTHGVLPYFALLLLAIVTWSFPGFISNCNLYEAALPIEARALWLSRIGSRLALLWLPTLAASATLAIGGKRSPDLLAGAAYWTVVILAVKRARIREFSAPPWVRGAAIGVAFVILGPFSSRIGAGGPGLPPAGIVIAICGLASAALFLSGWLAVPTTFQSAPLKPRASMQSTSMQRASRGPSRFVWSPVLRSFYDWKTVGWLPLVIMQTAIGFAAFAYIFLLAVIAPKKNEPGQWLWHLPVISRTLFRIKILPVAAAFGAGSVLRIFLDTRHPLTLRVRVVEFAAGLAILCLIFFLGELPYWRRLSRLKTWVRATPIAVGLLALFAPLVVSDARGSNWAFDAPFTSLAAALPESWWLLALALIAPVASLYWLAENTFSEMEYASLRAVEQIQ